MGRNSVAGSMALAHFVAAAATVQLIRNLLVEASIPSGLTNPHWHRRRARRNNKQAEAIADAIRTIVETRRSHEMPRFPGPAPIN